MYSEKLTKALGALHKLLLPPPRRAAWQWADEHRKLPSESAEPGPWRTSTTPWIRDITAAIASKQFRRVVAMMGSQCGKTDGVALNSLLHVAMDHRMPQLFIGPTKSNVEYISQNRLDKALRSTPELWAALAKGKKNTRTLKLIDGVPMALAWAGSITEISSRPIFIAYLDEVDIMENIPGQGHPLFVAEARISTYRPAGGLSVVTSTPTVGLVSAERDPESGLIFWSRSDEVHSIIWQLWQDGTMHHWAVPCLDCGEYFIPRSDLLWTPLDCSPQQALKEARLCCPACGSMLEDDESGKNKSAMNERGRFVSPGQRITKDGEVLGSPMESSTASYWVSGLVSPWISWGQRAEKWIEAKQSKEDSRIQPVFNTDFGECFFKAGQNVDWRELHKIKLPYKYGDVPEAVDSIFAAVDVQQDRLKIWVCGYDTDSKTGYLIETNEILGRTSEPDVYSRLASQYRLKQYGERLLVIDRLGIDYGYADSKTPVQDFCRDNKGWAIPMIGKKSMPTMCSYFRIDKTKSGKMARGSVKLMNWDTNRAKTDLFTRYSWPLEQPGGLFLPVNTPDYVLQELTAEQKIENTEDWIKVRKNDFLDAAAMAWVLAWQYLKKIRQLGDQMNKREIAQIRQAQLEAAKAQNQAHAQAHENEAPAQAAEQAAPAKQENPENPVKPTKPASQAKPARRPGGMINRGIR